jgi:hypothetical protein
MALENGTGAEEPIADQQSCQREINAYFENNHFDPISDPPKAVMKPITRQLVLKGNKKREVQEWLIQKGW